MVEGVLAVDTDERVIALNQAAARLLGADRGAAVGRSIQEVAATPSSSALVAETLAGSAPVEGELALRVGDDDRYAPGQRHPAAKRGRRPGHRRRRRAQRRDPTQAPGDRPPRLRGQRLARAQDAHDVHQGLRRDAARRRARRPRDARRFLRIVAGQADRLNAIIEDLLALSTLEQETEQRVSVARGGRRLRGRCTSPLEVCEHQGAEPRASRSTSPAPSACRADQRAPPGAGGGQSRRQRHQVQPRGRHGRSWPWSETADEVAILVSDHGPRHRAGAPAAALRAVLPRRQGPQPRARRHRPGPRHRQAHRPGPRRPCLGHQRGRPGQRLQDPSAARLSRLRRPLRAAPRPPRLISSSLADSTPWPNGAFTHAA